MIMPFAHAPIAYVPTATFGTVDITVGFDGSITYGYSRDDLSIGSKGTDTLCRLNSDGLLVEYYFGSFRAFEMEFASNADAITALADMQALYTGIRVQNESLLTFPTSFMSVNGSKIQSAGGSGSFGAGENGNTYTLEWY
ncbi:hypothetical protein [Roseovarius sp.]|uniref:hypothetical protein n=1 Tax=Roseovarius sp. TaxID=1486281 RepID=UPI003BA87C32